MDCLPRPSFTIRGGKSFKFMFIDQIKIAKQLGISGNSMRRILHVLKLDNEQHYRLINNKRCYDMDEVIKEIKKANAYGTILT